jgi:hypothetical protein
LWIRFAFWPVYLFYFWSRDISWLRTPMAWLIYGLLGAALSFVIVSALFKGAEYLLRKLRRSP